MRRGIALGGTVLPLLDIIYIIGCYRSGGEGAPTRPSPRGPSAQGVTQGAGAKRNFITRRFARLPIQFNINIRAPFQKLIGSYKSIYDPTFIRDPRSLGLVDGAGRPVNREKPPAPPSTPRKTGDIQPPVSRDRP